MKIKYLLSAGALVALSATAQTLQTTQKGDTTIIKVEKPDEVSHPPHRGGTSRGPAAAL